MIVRAVAAALVVALVVHLRSVMNPFLIFDSFLALVADLLIESSHGYDAVPTKKRIFEPKTKRVKNTVANKIKNGSIWNLWTQARITYLYAKEWTDNMNGRFFFSWCCTMLW